MTPIALTRQQLIVTTSAINYILRVQSELPDHIVRDLKASRLSLVASLENHEVAAA